ncbi:hypothetical protein GCM10011504_49740 [Siccirubricoccus deserti]|uniref:DUF4189 domain-containing protein n=1 Tax=Siccirubricoccus deserti TaxID=2013562 RepID=A0A9X0R4Z7_9PROT|nr:hypothetical protein [Siccirubricoccus deserti]MBC4018482.1 hypothetical protein [Siccirubricoccus deserti]GGC65817.1 hypothetical protein GCM10011504_49740 [Siccirubricoccus deserti]
MRGFLGAGLFVLALLPTPGLAQMAPCAVQHGGMSLNVGAMALDACARTIQAAQGIGSWGGRRVQTDGRGGVYLDGRFVGTAVNPSGTVGSLRDRCLHGDTAACNQWGRQSEAASRQMERMYPKGWAGR